MATFTDRDAVAVAQVTAYAFFLLLAIYLLGRDGLWSGLAWIVLILFSTLRIVGAALQISTVGNPSPENLLIAAAICSAIGLSPLFLIAIELLRRVNTRSYKYYSQYTETFLKVYSGLEEALLIAALILGIFGGVRAGNAFVSTGVYKIGTLTKVSTILFIVVYVTIIGSTVFAFTNYGRGLVRNRALLVAVILSLPFLLVRLIYSILEFLVGESNFNPVTGDIGFFIGLSFVMEILVVIFYISGGFATLRQPRRRQRRGSQSSSESSQS